MAEDLVERALEDNGYRENERVYEGVDFDGQRVLKDIETKLDWIARREGVKINYAIIPPALVPSSVAASKGLPLAVYVRKTERTSNGSIVETIY